MDAQAERERLLKIDAEWAAIASEGRDVDRMLSFWTDDAIVIAPGLPVVAGKAALREYVETSFRIPGFEISWSTTDCTVSADGSLAYMFSSNTVTADDPDGFPTTTLGRAVTIWRCEGDGKWRCAVDIWN